MRGPIKQLGRHLGRMTVLVVSAGLASAVLVRYSPGALVDENEMDTRLSEQSLAALRAEKAANADFTRALVRSLRGMARGDLGISQSHHVPVAALIAERAPTTLRELAFGLTGSWAISLTLAALAARFRETRALDVLGSLAAGLLLSLPAALLAYLCLAAGASASWVLLLVLTPRVFWFSRSLLSQAYGAPHVDMARARGVRERQILAWHVVPATAPQMVTLLAASVSMGIGALIPIEAICNAAGLGHLAWQAALARDLPLLINLTMLIAIATTAAMAIPDAIEGRRAA